MPPEDVGLIVDCETTGLEEHDEIIEIALVQFKFKRDFGEVISIEEKYSGLREPRVPIEPAASAVHKISITEILGRAIDEDKVRQLIGSSKYLISHNARFDRGFTEKLLGPLPGVIWLCTLNDIDWEEQQAESKSLDAIAKFFGIQPLASHRALPDALTLLSILNKQDASGIRILHRLLQHADTVRQNFIIRAKDSGQQSPLKFVSLHPSCLGKLKSGDGVVLWTKEHLDFINAYHYSSLPGGRPAIRLLKAENPLLTGMLDEDHEVFVEFSEATNDRVYLDVVQQVRVRYNLASLEAYHRLRNENKTRTANAKASEGTNPDMAVSLYLDAIEHIAEYAKIQTHAGISQELNERDRVNSGIAGDVDILDRLTLTLCRAGRISEAMEIAQRYFLLYKLDIATTTGEKILKRVTKARNRQHG